MGKCLKVGLTFKKSPDSVVFGDFHSTNIPTMGDFRLPESRDQMERREEMRTVDSSIPGNQSSRNKSSEGDFQ